MADRFEGGRRYGLSHKRLHLREIFVRADLQFLRRAPFLNLLSWGLRLIEATQTRDHAIDLIFSDQSFRKQLAQEPAVRQFSHFDGVLSNRSICIVE